MNVSDHPDHILNEIQTTVVEAAGKRDDLSEKMTQNERLDFLVEAFKADSVQYKDIKTPADADGKRRILRSLMNIRMPKRMDDSVLAVQDEYLRVLCLELGVGSNTPMIIKYPFWQMTNANEKAVYACLNYGEAYCPRQIEKQAICLSGDIRETMNEIRGDIV